MATGFAYKWDVIGEWQRLLSFAASFLRHLTIRKIINFVRVEYELALKKKKLKGFPYVLKVYANNKCNLKCPFCYTGMGIKMYKMGLATGENPSGEMDFHIFRHIVDELGPYCFRMLLYGYGEPLFHPKIYEMISYASMKNVGVAVSSNMTILKPGDADRIVKSGLELLTVSIDGVTQDSYEIYRVGGDYEQVVSNVKAVIEAKRRHKSKFPIIEWQFIVMRHNEHEMDKARQLATEWGIDILRFRPVQLYGTNDKAFKQWLPSNERLSLYDYKTQKIKKQEGTCAWLYRSGVISWDGSIAPCCYYNNEIQSYFGAMGNGKTFAETWNNESFLFSRLLTSKGRKAADPQMTAQTKQSICLKCDVVHIRH
jgi:MoaA/NifB/PqqE/SkfB family radical SAM enzyme